MSIMWVDRNSGAVAIAAVATLTTLMSAALPAAEMDFAATIAATRPIAYYRLDSTEGRSQAGTTEYRSLGGVTMAQPGAPTGIPGNQSTQLDGRDGYILTTQTGGVGAAASIMTWVDLAVLPSTENRFFYVAGESQNGNDLDIQFETDNALRFYTAAGGHLTYVPPVTTLVDQWHMIVATVDTVSQTRAIYWDGKLVARDAGGGRPGKTGAFSIGASTVFGGRFLKGGVAEAALWNRALKATEVASIYDAAKPTGSSVGSAAPGIHTGPFATTAKVEVEDSDGPVKLKREEQVAVLFLTAFGQIESDCQYHAKHACTMDQLVSGSTAGGFRIGHLKFDPKTDPNYTYTLAASGLAWEARAVPKKPGLIGFYFFSRSFPQVTVTYNSSGMAGAIDKELGTRSIEGDSFSVQ